ncbi:unnamed protein product [Symbiodinium sp. CCMP2592]|nr:unnamed protein product [Symbiodinium sp. CCMP2592]
MQMANVLASDLAAIPNQDCFPEVPVHFSFMDMTGRTVTEAAGFTGVANRFASFERSPSLQEVQGEASRGDLSRSEVSRLQSGGDNVAEGATEDPAARVPETPPKLKLPTSPAGSAKRMSAAPPTAAATAAAPQCWSMLPTTMAGSGAPTTDVRVKPIPVISCPAGSAMSGACGGALQPGTVKMISEPVVQPPSLLSSGYLYGRPRPVAH